jgi:hypothetical protein
MKIRILLFALLTVTPGFAQEPAKSQVQCHNIISGAQLATDEMVVGDKVCRKIQSAVSGETATVSISVQAAVATPKLIHTAAVTPAQPNDPASVTAQPASPVPVPLSLQQVPPSEGKLRVYVTDRPQTTEIMKTFNAARRSRSQIMSQKLISTLRSTMKAARDTSIVATKSSSSTETETISLLTRPANSAILSKMHAKQFSLPFRTDEVQ